MRHRCSLAAAAQHRANAGDQFARVEGFAEIVVGTQFQPDDAVHILLQRGQEDDRQLRPLRAHVAADVEPGPIRQQDIQHHEVNGVGRQALVQLAPVRGQADTKPLPLDELAEQPADLGIVIDDQDVGRGDHTRRLAPAAHAHDRNLVTDPC